MKNVILIIMLLMVSFGIINSQTKRITSTQTIGNTTYTYYDDGTCVTSQKIGNTTFHNSSNGTSGTSQQIGNTQFHNFNNGVSGTSQQIGNTQFHNFNNGVSGTTQKIGNTYFTNFNDGTNGTTQVIGKTGYRNLNGNSNSYDDDNDNSNSEVIYNSSNNNNQYSGYNNQISRSYSSYLNIVNNTDKIINFCYVSYEEYKGWQAVGWFQINSNSNITVNLGNYVGNNVYLYAEYNSGELFWADPNSRFSFCIDKSNAFTIPNSDSKACSESNYKRVQMYEMRVNAGINYWSLGN